MDLIKSLSDFVEVAQRNRKYPMNSVYGYRAALKVFGEELSPDERESLDLFKERFEQIYSNILNKRKTDFSITSLEIYKQRIKKIVADYEKYGVDPSKMANWNPQVITRVKSKSSKSSSVMGGSEIQNTADSEESTGSNYGRFDIPIRENAKITIIFPHDVTKKEAAKIEAFGVFLKSDARDEESP